MYIMNAMIQSVINKITEFKIKKLTKIISVLLIYILKQRWKIKNENEKLKSYDIEVKNAFTKVKYFNKILLFNSDKSESKPIMNKLVNLTLYIYIPVSEISYANEMKIYN